MNKIMKSEETAFSKHPSKFHKLSHSAIKPPNFQLFLQVIVNYSTICAPFYNMLSSDNVHLIPFSSFFKKY